MDPRHKPALEYPCEEMQTFTPGQAPKIGVDDALGKKCSITLIHHCLDYDGAFVETYR
jgi:hypothetical protein